MAQKTIGQVLREQTDRIMGLPGVAGMGQGLTDDGRDCIVVFAEALNDTLKKEIPAEIEGHPVRIEVTGGFRAL